MTITDRSTARWELIRALGALAEEPTDPVAAALALDPPLDRADHTEVFAFGALPYASAYLGTDGMLGGEAGARVAGFWRALGYEAPETPDHLAALLSLYARLGEQEAACPDRARRALIRQARTALLWEHLLPWTGVFCDLVRQAGVPPWGDWADLVEETLRDQWDGLDEPPDHLPRHLSHAPPPLTTDFAVAQLLAPLRTGIVVTRSDLAAAARSLGLGIRLTGRLPTLDALLGQAHGEMVAWLADHARRWEKQHRERSGPAPIEDFWADRAANTSAILDAILAGT